jgi:hypothetical protein|tara:strand:- start:2354 stop:2614 length:261 start_codon:yes stop_codon:yes gene_type:complete
MTHNKINKEECSVKKCLLQDREEDISIFITQEIEAVIKKLEEKNPDIHPGCLHMLVKNHLEYESLKIFHGLVEKYNPKSSKEVGVA